MTWIQKLITLIRMSKASFKLEKPKTLPTPKGDYSVTDRIRTYDMQSFGVPSQYQAVEGRKATYIVSANRNSNADFYNIQDAVDKAASYGGGIVYILNGSYRSSNTLEVPENVELIGESQSGVIIDFLNAEAGILFTRKRQNINRTGGVQRITVQNSGGIGINFNYVALFDDYIPETSRLYIKECSVRDSANGIVVNSTFPLYTMMEVSYNAVEVEDVGIQSISAISSVYIQNNIVTAFDGIKIEGEAVVTTNKITSGSTGITLVSPGSINLTCCDNFITSQSTGILGTSAVAVTIANNRIYASGYAVAGVNMDDSQVVGNYLNGGVDAVNLDASSDNNIVIGNNVRTGGITNLGTNNTVSPNTT